MPLVDTDRLAQVREQRIGCRRGRRFDGQPPDLGSLGRACLGAERAREHLAAEADPEHRYALVHGLAQERALAREKRKPLLVPRLHRAAQRHDAAEVARSQAVQIPFPGVSRDDRQPSRAHDAPEQPEPGKRGILLDGEDGLHARWSLDRRGQDFLGAAARRGLAAAFLAGAFLAVACLVAAARLASSAAMRSSTLAAGSASACSTISRPAAFALTRSSTRSRYVSL